MKTTGSGIDADEPPLTGSYLFYRYRGESHVPPQSLCPPYTWSIWHPSVGRAWPAYECKAKTRLRFFFRYCLDHLGLLANSDCGAMRVSYLEVVVT
jgi:hypothetical protein